jgi:hypothetical protein
MHPRLRNLLLMTAALLALGAAPAAGGPAGGTVVGGTATIQGQGGPAVTASTHPKCTPAAITRSISARAICGFVRAVGYSAGTPARSNRLRSFVQFSGRKRRKATITGTSPRASVSDTSVWQLAVLPRAEAYCGARRPRRPVNGSRYLGKAYAATLRV